MTRIHVHTFLAALACVCGALLSACGGNGDSVASDNAGSGSGNGGSTSSCSAVAAAAATRYYGVTPTGVVGAWEFDTVARTLSWQVDGAGSNTVSLVLDAASCTYTSSATGALRMSLTSNGLGVAAASIGGTATGALVMTAPESDVAGAAGLYNVMRYETDLGSSGSSARSGYATLQVDAAGSWRLCPSEAYSDGCVGGVDGTLAANADGGFDLLSGGGTVGRAFVKSGSGARVLMVAVHDASDATSVTAGMWVGATDTSFVAGQLDGVYVTDTDEGTTSLHTLAGMTLKPEARTSAVPLIANSPVAGLVEIVTGDVANDIGLLSSLGVYADVTTAADTGATPFIRFGVKQE